MLIPAFELALPWGRCVAVRLADDGDGRPPLPAAGPEVSLAAALAALHPAEQVRAASLGGARRRDWVAGRAALRLALGPAAAAADHAVDSDDRGAPRLPAGMVGSISHKRGLAVALADRADGWSRGVDVEPATAPRIDIAGRVLTAGERAAIAGLDDEARGVALILRFAIKEAVYKAVDPFVRRYVGFAEVAVTPRADGSAVVEIQPGAVLPLTIEAGWLRRGDLLVCSARACPLG